jgi:hypothetical protein
MAFEGYLPTIDVDLSTGRLQANGLRIRHDQRGE